MRKNSDAHVLKDRLRRGPVRVVRNNRRAAGVARPDGRKPGPGGKRPAIGNTVDVASASWSKTIGAAELGAVWTDPDFYPAKSTVYYALVLEIPTPPWYASDAFRLGIEIPKDAPTRQQ